MYPVIRVNAKAGDFREVAVASMKPENILVVRHVRSGDGSLPTQMPPAACLALCEVGCMMAGLKEII